ncbi:MAG: toxin [SAR324 cluster bacterium]|nr:toxin [SAR324 cluster bacterium]
MTKRFDWNKKKNQQLKNERNISFEEIIYAIEREGPIDIFPHSDQKKYPNQSLYEVNIRDYIYLVPFVRQEDLIFLKTIIPSRKTTRNYLKKGAYREV